MTHKEIKEYMLKKYKRQVELYKKAYKSGSQLAQQVFLSRIELLETILGDVLNWHVSVEVSRKNGTVIYHCFGHVGMTSRVIYNWNLKEDFKSEIIKEEP